MIGAMIPSVRRRGLPAGAVMVVLAACGPVERTVEHLFDSRTARERYEDALVRAGLANSALVNDWMVMASRSLAEAPAVTTPHVEEGLLREADVGAFAFRVTVRRGQEVTIGMQLHGDSTSQVFLDAFEVADSAGTLNRVAAADSGRRSLTVEPRRAGDYIFRAQPELLRGGRFTLRIGLAPTLAFPVARGSVADIKSGWGAPRDGGARDHRGVDIFARRRTPAIAATSGYIFRVDSNTLGGLVVWLRDDRGNRLYYAHLDQQTVTQGQYVQVGDTLGLIGNTGNARRTPPHLHFGVYRRGEGAMDPRWFVTPLPGHTPRLAVDTALLGARARVTRVTDVHEAPRGAARTRASLASHAEVQVLSAVGPYFRVRLDDGRTGYVHAGRVGPAPAALAVADSATRTRATGSDGLR